MIEIIDIGGARVAYELNDEPTDGPAGEAPRRCCRQREKEAVWRLVCALLGEGVEIGHEPTGAPTITGAPGIISVSHCRRGAAVAWTPGRAVGVDIETARQQLERVKSRFLCGGEMAAYGGSLDLLLRAWTAKEALYKAALTPGLPLTTGITLPPAVAAGEGHRFAGPTEAEAAGRPFELYYAELAPGVGMSLAIAPDEDI